MGEPSKKDASPREIGGFELITKIGQGGMGTVFKARQKSLDRVVALKVLPPSVAKDVKFIERFQREARACAKLNHPNIVQGVDVGKDPATGVWYFAMELIEGPSALQLLKVEKVLPEKRALEIVRDVAHALECAASQGVVHRDIKPDNILLTAHGDAKLADLGLARQINEDASLTQSGQAVGTPYYMAPEQVRGQADKFDTRTDIYALGATLFHLVTGQTPYTGETGAVIMAKHLTAPVPKAHKTNPSVSEACSRLIERMMQKEREQRIQTPKDVVAQIEKVLNNDAASTTSSATTKAPATAHLSTRRKKDSIEAPPSKTPLLVGGIAAVVVLIAVIAMRGSPAKPDAKPAPESRTAAAAPLPDTTPKNVPAPPAPVQSRPKAPATATATVEPEKESLPTSMLPITMPSPAPGVTVDPAPATVTKPDVAKLEVAPKPETPAAPVITAKLTDLPLADIFTALHANTPAKAVERIKDGNHPGKDAMMDALKALVAQREARFDAIRGLIGQYVKLDTVKGPQNGKLVSFEKGILNLEVAVRINGEEKGTSKALAAYDDLLPACRARIAPTPPPASSTDWLGTALVGMADKQLDAAETALGKVDAGELRDILLAELKRTRVTEREAQAATAWAKIVARAAETLSQSKAKQLLEDLAAFNKGFASSDFAGTPEMAEKIKEMTETLERLSLGLDARVLKLFKGRVLNYDAGTQVITLGYDLQTREQCDDFIDSTWAPPGDTTGITWKKGELKTFCKGTADRVFRMPQFMSGTLAMQFEYKKCAFAWKRYEVEISFWGLDSTGKSTKFSFKGTDKGAYLLNGAGTELKTNTDEPMFAKDGTLDLMCQGQALTAKVNGKPVIEYPVLKPNDHTGFWIGGGWDSGITFTKIQISGRLDATWLQKALAAAPKGR